LDEIGNYPPWAIALVFVGIGVLIYGVTLLSSKSDPTHSPEEDEELQTVPEMSAWSSNEKIVETQESSSTSHQVKEHPTVLSNIRKKMRNLTQKTLPKREMDTFISLHSQQQQQQQQQQVEGGG
jgi:aconitase A